jgi:hypothetical protein
VQNFLSVTHSEGRKQLRLFELREVPRRIADPEEVRGGWGKYIMNCIIYTYPLLGII